MTRIADSVCTVAYGTRTSKVRRCASRAHGIQLLLLIALLCGHGTARAQFASTGILPPVEPFVLVDENGVSVTNGTLSLSKTDLSIGAVGYSLELTRYFSLNTGWRDSLSGFLKVVRTVSFPATSTASWGNQSWGFGPYSAQSKSGDGATLTGTLLRLRDGTTISFSQALPVPACTPTLGFPCEDYSVPKVVTYPNGVVLNLYYRIFSNPVSARVQSVVSSAGYQVKYTYASDTMDSSLDALKRVSATAINNGVEYCDPTANSCSLSSSWPSVTYSSTDGATSTLTVTDVSGGVTRYTRSASAFSIKSPGRTTDNIQYSISRVYNGYIADYETRVTSAVVNSETWQYAYSNTNPRIITITDPLQYSRTYTSVAGDYGWMLEEISDPLTRVTNIAYPCSGNHDGDSYINSNVNSVVFPEGNEASSVCDARGNVTSITRKPKPGSGMSNIVTTFTFASTCTTGNEKVCNQPTAIVDGRGSQTDFTYSSTHGGVLTQTFAAVTVCQPDGSSCTSVRPQKRYSYEQIRPYVKNSAGSLVAVANPVWVLKSTSECRTSSSCSGGADEVATVYGHPPAGVANRLFVSGVKQTAGGVTRRTCNSYDSTGNVVSVTTPRAALGVCP